ncbi:MAG: DUF4349 domain-containing protein [Ruminococcus sp.]|nr:DUF4349 domain-containing protein [Ruminococcus sp.]
MKRKIYKASAVLILSAFILAGCSSKSLDMAEDTAAGQTVTTNDSGGYNGYMEESKEASAVDVEMDMETSEDTAEEAGAIAQEVSEKDLSKRKLIKTVSLSMETKTFDALKKQMEESVSSFGGYIENSSYDAPQGGQQYRYYYLCVRIPADQLDTFVGKAGEMGTITNKSESVEDVTLDYVDKTAYKESLQTEYERVTKLLEQAEDLDQILALESKLSELRYEINSYESQLRTYDNRIDYGTVHIYISEVEYEQETSDTVGSRISNGFRNSLFSVRDFFVNAFVFLVSNLPVILLLIVIAGIVVFTGKKAKGRFHRRSHRKAEENKETKDSSDTQSM